MPVVLPLPWPSLLPPTAVDTSLSAPGWPVHAVCIGREGGRREGGGEREGGGREGERGREEGGRREGGGEREGGGREGGGWREGE